MQTLLLDGLAWDLVLNTAGDIAVASDPYALAQDAASAIRLFRGELWYDTAKGVPYFSDVLGKAPPITLMKGLFVSAAMSVPGVLSAECFISSISSRGATGQVQVRGAAGTAAAAF